MFLHVDIIVATSNHEDRATIAFTSKESIEITVDVGCTSPGLSFAWSIPGNIESSSKPCPGNPYFNTSKSILRTEKPTKNEIILYIRHHPLISRSYTWYLNSSSYTSPSSTPGQNSG